MSETLRAVQALIAAEKLRVSDHAYDELADDHLVAEEVIAGVDRAVVVEDYPTYAKGSCVLVLHNTMPPDCRSTHSGAYPGVRRSPPC